MVNTPRISSVEPGKVPSVPAASTQNIILNIPKTLLQFPEQTLLKALVTAADQQGNVTLQTANGTLTVKTLLPLLQGSTLQLRVSTTSNNNLQLQLISVNDHPAEEALSLPSRQENITTQKNPAPLLFRSTSTTLITAPPPNVQGSSPAVETTFSELPILYQVKGFVTSPKNDAVQQLLQSYTLSPSGTLAPEQPASVSSATPLPPTPTAPTATANLTTSTTPGPNVTLANGQPITLRIINSYIPPQPFAPTAPAPAPGDLPSATNVPSPSANTGTETPQTTPFPAGKFPYRNPVLPQPVYSTEQAETPSPALQQPSVPSASETSSPPLAAKPAPFASAGTLPQFNGLVVGNEKSGDTLVQTPIGTIKLTTDAPIPKGAQLTFELVAVLPAETAITAPLQPVALTGKDDGLSALFKQWKGLEDGLKNLESSNKSESLATLQKALPTANKDFALRLQQFISAVQTGDVEKWLGKETVQTLRHSGENALVDQLGKDFSSLQKLLTPASQNNTVTWNSLLFPVFDGSQLHQARMFVRYQEEGSGKKSSRQSKQTRFIVELSLNNLGPMQFDGLVQNQPAAKQFDLIIRSESALDNETRQGIAQIFSTTQEITGMTGTLTFETASPFPIQPAEEVLKDNGYGHPSLMV